MTMNKNITPDYFSLHSLGEMWDLLPSHCGDIIALSDPHSEPEVRLTYEDVAKTIKQFASALQSLDIKFGEKIALFNIAIDPRQGLIINPARANGQMADFGITHFPPTQTHFFA